MTRSYFQPTLEKCPKCGRDTELAFYRRVEDYPEDEVMPCMVKDDDVPEMPKFDVVELEVMRPCGHGVPRELLQGYVQEARELSKCKLHQAGTKETYDKLREEARKVEWSDEEFDMNDAEREVLGEEMDYQ